ncbi:NUDIX hydrolase [Bacillus sp. Marseille-P3800]|uniref:NUDIX hydrolase n=1 Tax=Bacillus sp. Marseille-P3800 TaxID=2014782 RepID=UPI000C078B9C|nr:NUDIX domain-containing protein [Bacillus sp. Marseille-P3800]
MNEEKIHVYTSAREPINITDRKIAHEKGLWHQTFHLWIMDVSEHKPQLYLQLRSQIKKDFPNLFDITAAGHLLAEETPLDGLREVEEELGLSLTEEDISFIGQFLDVIHTDTFLDQEFALSYVYFQSLSDKGFQLQKEEVAGIVKVPFYQFKQLCFNETSFMNATGFYEDDGQRFTIAKKLTRDDLVPHSLPYLQQTAIALENQMNEHGSRQRKRS